MADGPSPGAGEAPSRPRSCTRSWSTPRESAPRPSRRYGLRPNSQPRVREAPIVSTAGGAFNALHESVATSSRKRDGADAMIFAEHTPSGGAREHQPAHPHSRAGRLLSSSSSPRPRPGRDPPLDPPMSRRETRALWPRGASSATPWPPASRILRQPRTRATDDRHSRRAEASASRVSYSRAADTSSIRFSIRSFDSSELSSPKVVQVPVRSSIFRSRRIRLGPGDIRRGRRSNHETSQADVARFPSFPSSARYTSFAHSERAVETPRAPRPAAAGCRRRPSSDRSAARASMHALPDPSRRDVDHRRRLTSSCGLITASNRRARP